MTAPFTLSFRPDVTLAEDGADGMALRAGHTVQRWRPVSRGARAALARLADGGAGADALSGTVLEADGITGLGRWHGMVQAAEQMGVVCRSLVDATGTTLARLVPQDARFRFVPTLTDAAPLVLSRFATLRREGDHLTLTCGLAHAALELHAAAAACLTGLLMPGTVEALATRAAPLPPALAHQLLVLLANAGALATVRPDGTPDEDADPVLGVWEAHDLAFHTRSRMGRTAAAFGGTYRNVGRTPPPPMRKAVEPLAWCALERPDPHALAAHDPPFAEVLGRRASVREQGEAPLTRAQLGEFLYRCAHVQRVVDDGSTGLSFRPHPAGGALHETELYAVVDRVDGLPSGIYYYDPHEHRLGRVAERTPAVGGLLQQAYYTADRRARPQVLLVITARFPRIQWKYESMAYATMLKHVGVLMQTMYLAATAMRLAPCALGTGDSDLFAEAAGLDYLAETSVGEFILGTLPEGQ